MTGRAYRLPTGALVVLHTPQLDELRVYRAAVVEVVDGDTLKAEIDVGVAGIWLRPRKLRLAGCNARESRNPGRQPGGPEAKAHLAALLPPSSPIQVQVISETADPHGRWIASVALPNGTDLVEYLVTNQWAARWDGHTLVDGKPPVPPWPREV